MAKFVVSIGCGPERGGEGERRVVYQDGKFSVEAPEGVDIQIGNGTRIRVSQKPEERTHKRAPKKWEGAESSGDVVLIEEQVGGRIGPDGNVGKPDTRIVIKRAEGLVIGD